MRRKLNSRRLVIVLPANGILSVSNPLELEGKTVTVTLTNVVITEAAIVAAVKAKDAGAEIAATADSIEIVEVP